MRSDWQEWMKKLALAYETGWEYIPGSEEPGSVLMDIFLEMAEENQKRFDRIWEKQESVFLQAAPDISEVSGGGRGALLVKVHDEEDGRLLKEGTETYAAGEDGEQLCFLTAHTVRLTSARLKAAVYRKGMWAWLSYEEGQEGEIPLFQPTGKMLAHPVFRWRFRGLCDGRAQIYFHVEFAEEKRPAVKLPGKWSVSDGERVYPMELQQEASRAGRQEASHLDRQAPFHFGLAGRTPEFGRNFAGGMYEICLEVLPGEELTEEWLRVLRGGFALTEPPKERQADLCITDSGAGNGRRVLPFGTSPEEGSCCYFACDREMAGGENEAELRFLVDFLTEERLPEPRPEEYKKLCRKYPWLQYSETVQDWRAQDASWEYFNGKFWCVLPESEGWQIFEPEEGARERVFRWKRPRDMAACSVEGEEHYYIRLALRRVSNAYALYYRKAIPVLEEIRFWTEGRRMVSEEEVLTEGMEVQEEKMYLGFEGEVTCDQCWYTGENFCFFDQEQLMGKSVLYEKEAFWVEAAEKEVSGEKGASLSCLLPNYVPIAERAAEKREGTAEKGEGAAAQKGAEVRIGAGTEFSVESQDMGILEAVCLSDICCAGAARPALSKKQASKHYFAHYGRMLTPMDVEIMLQERYPFLKAGECVFREEEGVLYVELAAAAKKGDMRSEEELWKEAGGRLREIEEWLAETAAGSGTLWLNGCGVRCSLRNPQENRTENG